MSQHESSSYQSRRRKANEFSTRSEYLEHELNILSFKKWRIHQPFRDFGIEIEDWVPAIAATIGKVVMVTAMVAAFAAQFGLSPEFVAENVRYELIIAGLLFVIFFSAILNPRANLAGTHGPMIPLIPLVAAAGGHPLALGIMVGVFGLILSATKGGSKLVRLTGEGVRGGLLIYLGAVGLISQLSKFESWSVASGMESVSFVVISTTIVIYAYLAKIEKRWLAIPLCSLIAGVVSYLMGVPFEFTTEPGLPNMSPFYWWGEETGWQLGWPEFEHYIAVIPFAILAVAMWSPDFLGHRVFQELNYPKTAKDALMDVDDTMTVCSIRQIIGAGLGGGNLASSWGTYMIPAAIAKRPIPGGALLTGILCIVAAVLGYPMDLAMWEPVLRVALLVGVFLPLLEAGMQMVRNARNSQSAGICMFACALVNPVFGWAITMLLDNTGLIGNRERSETLNRTDRLGIPLATVLVCVGALAAVGQLPGIPALL
ncbi:DUF3360 family protein [Vibrio vulnificus]|uniref:DUF3360 family protein n=1 Tax=Vibrio vulnificus TaxID=672 RepID=UPI001023D14F|nr:DUF3360 family protein [Vibrio vulnificus]EGQ7928945.1 DUF3360 family protein [Vibrio vulnificus]EGQ9281420.1 DUF3360 family protein [Vibrio vulnificus]EGQ9968558.1 DUF3360 family protein [Vibrio vulnificus]EIJ0941287.1 DUF3360 family protein [Vibrio vulnificus]EIV8496271.1 DUF3360 family protein [Vibrio vulnificus]